eukprot:314288-Rhodomonas_salina.1
MGRYLRQVPGYLEAGRQIGAKRFASCDRMDGRPQTDSKRGFGNEDLERLRLHCDCWLRLTRRSQKLTAPAVESSQAVWELELRGKAERCDLKRAKLDEEFAHTQV